MTLRDRFDQEAVWGRIAQDPSTELRVQTFEEMIPERVEQVADVGCGDGAITNRLAASWDVTGIDLSAAALAHLKTRAVQASATELPFPDDSFDLVLSSEMLEHMPTESYVQAIAEMRRVTRRYLLISVPYREDLRFRIVRCPRCGWRGHVWGHRQTFTAESLLGDLNGFTAVQTRTFGPVQEPPWPRWLLWTTQNILKSYYWAPGQHPMCERCQNTDFTATRAVHPLIRRFNQRIRSQRRPFMPFWMAVLAEARSA